MDQITKLIALNYLADNYIVKLIPGILHLNLVTNYGAAFSILNNSSLLLKYISLVASLVFALMIFLNFYKTKLEQLGLAFLMAGSIGNGIDRWLYGYVIDFIDIKAINFPIFNIADIAINVAILIILLDILNKRKKNIYNQTNYNYKTNITINSKVDE